MKQQPENSSSMQSKPNTDGLSAYFALWRQFWCIQQYPVASCNQSFISRFDIVYGIGINLNKC